MPYTTNVAGTVITAAYGNTNIRDQVVTPFSSAASRTSAVTAPVEGIPSWLTDADQFDVWNGSRYVPIGPLTYDSLRITAASPFVTAMSGSSETEISSSLRLTIPRIYQNQLMEFRGQAVFGVSGAGDWVMRIRKTNTSGTVVGGFWVNQAGPVAWNIQWPVDADGSSVIFLITATRLSGTSTFDVYNTLGTVPVLYVAAGPAGDTSNFRAV